MKWSIWGQLGLEDQDFCESLSFWLHLQEMGREDFHSLRTKDILTQSKLKNKLERKA
jgi:hypothetical protein